MWLETIHSPAHNEDKCPTCGGGIRKRVFGEMHAGSFILNGQWVEIRRVPNPDYADPIVLDELTQYFRGALYRIWPSDRYYSKGGSRLHRDAWKAAFGPIPAGCHIHHRDGNPENNLLANLECQDASEHLSNSRAKRTGNTISDAARAGAAAWHGSDAGRLWHKQHAERSKSWTKWKRESKRCPECNAEFLALVRKSGNAQIYCGSPCKVAAYRKRGKQNEWAAAHRAREAVKRNG